jgi:hypothetical protein
VGAPGAPRWVPETGERGGSCGEVPERWVAGKARSKRTGPGYAATRTSPRQVEILADRRLQTSRHGRRLDKAASLSARASRPGSRFSTLASSTARESSRAPRTGQSRCKPTFRASGRFRNEASALYSFCVAPGSYCGPRPQPITPELLRKMRRSSGRRLSSGPKAGSLKGPLRIPRSRCRHFQRIPGCADTSTNQEFRSGAAFIGNAGLSKSWLCEWTPSAAKEPAPTLAGPSRAYPGH